MSEIIKQKFLERSRKQLNEDELKQVTGGLDCEPECYYGFECSNPECLSSNTIFYVYDCGTYYLEELVCYACNQKFYSRRAK